MKRLFHSPRLLNWSVNGSKLNWSFKQASNSFNVLKCVFFLQEGGFSGRGQLLGDFGEFLHKFLKKHNLVTWRCRRYLIYTQCLLRQCCLLDLSKQYLNNSVILFKSIFINFLLIIVIKNTPLKHS